jgi:hypothetical protein
LGEGTRRLLRQVVADPARDQPVSVPPDEVLGISGGLGMRSTIGVTLQRDRRDADDAASLSTADGASELQVWTTEPGLQVYDGHLLAQPDKGLEPYLGMCLQPQRFPDGPNNPDFPSCRLSSCETYGRTTEYWFHLGKQSP